MSSSDRRPASSPLSVLVVDEDARERALLTALVAGTPGFHVIADVATGYQAIRAVHELNPDVVTLDLEGGPGDRGLEVLAWITNEAPRPVIILSQQALALPHAVLGAVDFAAIEFVVKPVGRADDDVAILRRRLGAALEAAANTRIGGLRMDRAKRAAARASRAARRATRATGDDAAGPPATCVVAIAASTGGPRALLHVVPRLPAHLPAAVLVVQHMPAGFTRLLAERLDRTSALRAREAISGETLKASVVYLAPGGLHMSLQRAASGVSILLEDSEPVWGIRPAADVLFGAVARHFGPCSMGVVLTGMGRDGAAGLRAIAEVGGWTAVQDETTAIIASMPRAAAEFAARAIPLDQMARALANQANRLARAAAG